MLLSLSISPSDTTTFGAEQNVTTSGLPTGDENFEDPDPNKWFSLLENVRILLKVEHRSEISDLKMLSHRFYIM